MANHAATGLAQRLGEIVGDLADGHADVQLPVALQALPHAGGPFDA